MISVNTYARM